MFLKLEIKKFIRKSIQKSARMIRKYSMRMYI